jgi:hypothetical protein
MDEVALQQHFLRLVGTSHHGSTIVPHTQLMPPLEAYNSSVEVTHHASLLELRCLVSDSALGCFQSKKFVLT